MKRISILTAIAVASALLVIVAAQAVAHTARAAKSPTLKLGSTSKGMILEAGNGFTIYEFTADSRNHDSCITKAGCPQVWPAITTSGMPTGGPGVKANLIGTIRLSSGKTQVTYAGHPLYRYSGDHSPGSTDYIGVNAFGGNWNALSASGKPIK